jgi:hypothetical protein
MTIVDITSICFALDDVPSKEVRAWVRVLFKRVSNTPSAWSLYDIATKNVWRCNIYNNHAELTYCDNSTIDLLISLRYRVLEKTQYQYNIKDMTWTNVVTGELWHLR